MHICLAFKSWLGCVLTQAGRLSFPGPMQIWASWASPSVAAAGAEAQNTKAGGYEAGWGRTVSFGGFILCRIKKGKMELDPFKSLRKASEAVGVTEPAVCEQVSAPAVQGRFLLGFLCITPARSQTQQKYPFYKAQVFFPLPLPPKCCWMVHLLQQPKGGEGLSRRAAGRSPRESQGGWPSSNPLPGPGCGIRMGIRQEKPLANFAPAAPSTETSEQNVPSWELETSSLLVADLKKTLHTPKTVPLAPPRTASGRWKKLTSTTALSSY